ncbi:hypothetical protein DRH27_05075, partial [Candidatus Falkowbacteria bacterium]
MEQKKKILYLITQSELGGAQKYVMDLATNLGPDFETIVAFGEQGKQGELAKALKPTNIIYYTIPHLKRAISPWHDFLALIEIIKLINRLKPDIVHLNSSKISILGSLASFFYKLFTFNFSLLTIYTVHGWVFNEPERNALFYKYAEKFTAIFKNKLICVSEYDRQLAIKEKIVQKKKLITIHNGIQSISLLSRDEARQKLFSTIPNFQFPISNFVIGSIGNLYKTKGFEYLISAVKILIDVGFNVKTIIIGEGKERPALENLIKKLKIEKYVFLAGRIKNAPRLLKTFDLYVCSSVKEGLSYTIIEAMQAGLPIVA